MISELFPMLLASAICTAVLAFGFRRRPDGSRRGIFIAGGIICSILTIVSIGILNNFGGDLGVILTGAALACLGIVGLVLGWRGKRVGDHPYCRKCGFDLYGKPETSTRCNECGTELSARIAVLIGQKRFRGGTALGGVFLLMLGMMLAARPTYEMLRDINWYEYRPFWLVLADMDVPQRRDRAEREVAFRADDNRLSSGQRQKVVQRAIKDPAKRTYLAMVALDLVTKHEDIDEATVRQLLVHTARWTHFWRAWDVAARGHPVRFGEITSEEMARLFLDGYPNLSVKHRVVEDRVGDLLIPPANVIRGEPCTYDLSPLWNQLSNGPTQFARKVEFVVTLPYRGKVLKEEGSFVIASPTKIVEASEAMLPLVEPTGSEINATWTAQLVRTSPPELWIHRSLTGTAAVASVWSVRDGKREKIGMLWMRSGGSQGFVDGIRPFKVEESLGVLELIPAPEEGIMAVERVAILNQKVTIKEVKVVDKPREMDSSFDFAVPPPTQ